MTVGKVVLALIVLWVLFILVGLVVKALFWLFVIGLVLFGFTLAGEGRRRGIIGRR